MADWTTWEGTVKNEAFGESISGSTGTTVTSGAADTKGSWVELTASTNFDYDSIDILIRDSGTALANLLDIAVGGSGSEEVILENLLLGRSDGSGDRVIHTVRLPFHIKKGSRIACRHQADNATSILFVMGRGYSSNFTGIQALGKAVTYGADTVNTKGVVIDPGTTVDTKGSWVELSAATSDNIKAILFRIGNNLNAAPSLNSFLFDIAIGGSGSEEIVVADIPAYTQATSDLTYGDIIIPLAIKAGSRLAVRSQSTETGADRLLDVTIHGLT